MNSYLKLWSEAKNCVHDISGIGHPEEWNYIPVRGVYYPKDQLDLFNYHHLIPNEVHEIINNYSFYDNTYENCAKLVADLNSVGFTCDYYLDAEPFNLRRCTS